MLVVAFFWGAGFTSSKAAVADVPPLATATMRYVLASLVLIPIYLSGRRSQGFPVLPVRSAWAPLLALAVTAVLGYNILYFVGLTLAPSSDAILLIPTTNPVWTILFAMLVIDERPSGRVLAGIAVAMAGMSLVLIGGYQGTITGGRLLGDLLFVGGSIIFGLSHVMGRLTTRRINPLEATTLAGIVGGLMLAALAVPWGGYGALLDAPLAFWLNIALVAFGTTALGYVLVYRSISRVGPGLTSFYLNLVPVFGLLLSGIFLDEIPTLLQIAGGVIVILAVAWAGRARAPETAPAQAVQQS